MAECSIGYAGLPFFSSAPLHAATAGFIFSAVVLRWDCCGLFIITSSSEMKDRCGADKRSRFFRAHAAT
jgi:hypothetical protein